MMMNGLSLKSIFLLLSVTVAATTAATTSDTLPETLLGRSIQPDDELHKLRDRDGLRPATTEHQRVPAQRRRLGKDKKKGLGSVTKNTMTRKAGREPRSTHHHKPRKHEARVYYQDDDRYYDTDDYYNERDHHYYYDDYYYSSSSKGSSKGYSKGSSKGKGGKGYHYDFYPTVDDIAFLDDEFFDDGFFEDDDCELVTFNETFAMPGPTLFLAPDTTITEPGDPDLPGTVFIFQVSGIFEADGVTAIDGTTVTGTCTRTTVGVDGGGQCSLVFLDDEGFTISVDGFLPGPLGGKMAISGGTGGMVGVIGEMDFFPIFNEDDTDTTDGDEDIFLDAIRYEVIADLGLIVCPSQHH